MLEAFFKMGFVDWAVALLCLALLELIGYALYKEGGL
jgi:hypothetical protein